MPAPPRTVAGPLVTPSPPRPAAPPPAQLATAKAPVARPTPAEAARLRWLDVAGASVLILLGAFAAFNLPAGPLRMALALPVLLFAPGYLLLQALVVPPARGTALMWQCFASVGISPAVVGLLALSTSIVEGGFKLGAIVVLVTIGSLAFTAGALVRRRSLARSVGQSRSAPKTLAQPTMGGAKPAPVDAARAKTGPTRP